METLYNDEMLPENFEQIARAYSQKMKENGFVFIHLKEEETNLLAGEILTLFAKMQACLQRLERCMKSDKLKCRIESATSLIEERFLNKKTHTFRCVENENDAFLSLVSIENTVILKLMLLSVKTNEFELCNNIITGISGVFAESFSQEGFVID